jgi:hypothetical protein
MLDTNKEIISKLKFIGHIHKGDKINTRYMYVQSSGFITSLSRTFFNHDNRGNTLTFVQETINRSFELFTMFERSDNDSDKAMCANIIQDLNTAKKGLINLRYTYKEDLKFSCDMDTLLQVITTRLISIFQRHPSLDKNFDDLKI